MRPMRASEIVELLPFREFCSQVEIVGVSQELIELLLVSPVRPLDLPVQLRGPWLDVDVPHALILDVPMELSLPLMATIGSNGVNAKRKLLDHIVDEVNRTFLSLFPIDLEGADTGCIVNGRKLIATDSATLLGAQTEKLHIDLDLMTGDLLGVAARMDGAAATLRGSRPTPLRFRVRYTLEQEVVKP